MITFKKFIKEMDMSGDQAIGADSAVDSGIKNSDAYARNFGAPSEIKKKRKKRK